MSSKSQHLHAGHRDRMRERFLQTDGNGMAEHELLELLLFYAIPRCDTNDLAHRLIEEFGSLVGVLEADSSALCAVSGISEKSALYLRLVGKAATLYTAKKLIPDAARDRLDTPEKVAAWNAAGFTVRAWGIRDQQDMAHAYLCGTDGQTINFPDKLTAYLKDKE